MKKIIRIGKVELYEEEAAKIYSEGKYIITCSRVYAVHYSNAVGYYGSELHYKPRARYTRPGRFFTLTAKQINDVLGFSLLNE